MTVKAKICGLTTEEAVKAALDNGAVFLGFVFFTRSPRNITPEKAARLTTKVPANVKTAAVLVDPTNEDISGILKSFKPDYLQLHGNESLERVRDIKQKFGTGIIKAIKVRTGDDIAAALPFTKVSDILLFDSKAPAESVGLLPGGNGLRFDWSLLQGRDFQIPWMLSGGLNIENVAEAVKLTGARMVDVSSSLEDEPGRKNPALVKRFLDEVKKIK